MPFSIPSSVRDRPATVHLRLVQKPLTEVRTEYFLSPGLRVSKRRLYYWQRNRNGDEKLLEAK